MVEKTDGPPSSENFVDTVCQDVRVIEKVERTLDVVYPGLLECSADEETKHGAIDGHIESTGHMKEEAEMTTEVQPAELEDNNACWRVENDMIT